MISFAKTENNLLITYKECIYVEMSFDVAAVRKYCFITSTGKCEENSV